MAKRTLPLSKIRLDGNTQPRVELDEFLITEYQEAYAREAEMPPLQVKFDGVSYWLWDGFHRRWAAERAGLDKLQCIVTEGTQQDAQWASYGANIDHGLRRSNADKAKAVKAALRHPKGVKKSDGQISEWVGVSQPFVSKIRRELETTQNNFESESRTGRDGRTINTANIGKRTPAITQSDAAPVAVFEVPDMDEATDDEGASETQYESYDSADYDELPGDPESDEATPTIGSDLKAAVYEVMGRWPDVSHAVIAAVLENLATAIRSE